MENIYKKNIESSNVKITKQERIDLNNKIRVYGNILGSTTEIISFLHAIEINYIYILAYQKMIEDVVYDNIKNNRFIEQDKSDMIRMYYGIDPEILKCIGHSAGSKFMDYQKLYDVYDIVSVDDYPMISKINYNSPGFWEFVASWNPFEQIREYIKERHSRINDKKNNWELDRKIKETEIESKRLSNDLLKLDISQKMIVQLKELGLTDIEIRHTVLKCYENLELLNSHIDNERIVEIELIKNE